jgi:VIT1/CCC1 family predicted Fe2+/Mn2+ transporter
VIVRVLQIESTLAQDVLRDAPVLSTWTALSPGPVLDPLERTSEILFGVIMVLTFTSSISVAEGGNAETREVLVAALACNVAWGIVDAAFYLMASAIGYARGLRILHTIRENRDPGLSQRLILDALPSPVSAVLKPSEVEELRDRLARHPVPAAHSVLNRRDLRGAIGVFLLVFLSTLPISLPFLLFSQAGFAMRASNAVAIAMLFGMGWTLGTHTGRSGWGTGLAMVCLGLVLVAITIALGG